MCALLLAAIRCVEEQVVAEPWMVDLGMVLGTGFAPFPRRTAADGGRLRAGPPGPRPRRVATDVRPAFFPCELLREMGSRGARFYPEEHAEEPATLRESEIRNNSESSKVGMTETPGHD